MMDYFMRYLFLCITWVIFSFSSIAYGINPDKLLRAEEAFKVVAQPTNDGYVKLSWDIAEGYYLYRKKIAVQSQTAAVTIEHIDLPTGDMKHDPIFGEVIIYRHQLESLLSLQRPNSALELTLLVKYQGCADLGVCYPPQSSTLKVQLPSLVAADATGFHPLQTVSQNFKLGLNLFSNELLPAEEAFQFFATVQDAQTVHVNWDIADGYYLYREKIALQILGTKGVELLAYDVPKGKPKHDEAFGDVEVLHHALSFNVPLKRSLLTEQSITLKASFQGCADRGVCYPPMEKTVTLLLPAVTEPPLSQAVVVAANKEPENPVSEQALIIQSLHQDSLALTLFSFLGFGLLLAFTPCVFPMIPILSGIIIGQGESISQRKAFMLSLCFVVASALTYTIFGVLAALFGSNLQATFQAPWIIYLFSGLFVALSFSMFGFYQIELPKSLQSRLHNASDQHRDGSYLGAGLMGVFSSLIVGPCVAAPLAAALMYIGQTGDVFLGGSALFMMGLGMGVPLLIVGASAGSLLPKAGRWLNASKSLFGVIMLAVAVWMLERVLAPEVTMVLWALLCIIPAIYLRALDPLPEVDSGWHKLWKGCGVVLLAYGLLILIGISAGNTDPLQPLKGLTMGRGESATDTTVNFKRITSLAELDHELAIAQQKGQWLMLDFYADWCISCKEMDKYTLSDPAVKQELSRFVLIQADVTENNAESKALLKRFKLVGPPAILFFNKAQQEDQNMRVIGYQKAPKFLAQLRRLR